MTRTTPPRPNVRLADLLKSTAAEEDMKEFEVTPSPMRQMVEWLLHSRVLWRVK